MKKVFILLAGCLFIHFANAQEVPPPPAANNKVLPVNKRAADHLMFQVSSDHWASMPDSIGSHQEGLSRGFNAYFMFDKNFKNTPKFSVAIGVGVSTSNMMFKKMGIDLKASGSQLPFNALDSTNHFKKYKLATTYLEAPLEFRYMSSPTTPNKSWKGAIGFKAGTLLNAHTKGKTLQDKNNNSINSYTEKITSKRFINGTRFSATARVGYGVISIFGTYQLNSVLKEGAGSPDMRLYQVGLMISGL